MLRGAAGEFSVAKWLPPELFRDVNPEVVHRKMRKKFSGESLTTIFIVATGDENALGKRGGVACFSSKRTLETRGNQTRATTSSGGGSAAMDGRSGQPRQGGRVCPVPAGARGGA
jgi:hypothetical protein